MPPPLASFFTLLLIFFLFRRDLAERPNVTRALWLPFWWLLIACSREATEWLQLFGIPVPGGTLEGGTPVDRLFYIGMIAAGLVVLRKRQLNLTTLFSANLALTLFLFYCFMAVFWSDYPFVSLKRWIKVLGHPIMAVIILTEPEPQESIVRLVKRCAYVLVPVSILYIKYYPELGRGFDSWSGIPFNTGITTDKNALGINCLIIGFVLFWHFIRVLRDKGRPGRRDEILFCLLFLYMNGWLSSMADSKTSLVAMSVGIAMVVVTGFRWINRNMFTIYLLGGSVLLVIGQQLFGIYEAALEFLGRNANLTDRTRIWEDVLKVDINPLFGTGFESFWLGDRLKFMDTLWAFGLNQAHNGYLETYLNLGIIGVAILLALLIATYRKALRTMQSDTDWGRFRLGLIIAIIVYNWTEAAFKTTHPIFFFLYIIAIDYYRPAPEQHFEAEESSAEFLPESESHSHS